MTKMGKKKLCWWLVFLGVLISGTVALIIYFGFIKDYEKEKLIEIGYSEEEICEIREELPSSDIIKLYKYNYLSYLITLLNAKEYKHDNFITYLNYINAIDGKYDLDMVIYLVNNDINYSYSEKLVNIIQNKYFIRSRLDRYMIYDNDNINTIITNINSNLDYDFYTNIRLTNIEDGNLLIVNKYYYIEKDYYYGELVKMDSAYDNRNGDMLNSVAYDAFKKLVDDAEKAGYHIRNNSAYRSYDTQSNLYNNYKNRNGEYYADKWSARAGHSEHQTGLALDVGVQTKYAVSKFEYSKEFVWMKDNCYKYGFILRYPKEKQHITGYGYEPWHYRYVGIEAATYIYENDITFEEYYAYFVDNK